MASFPVSERVARMHASSTLKAAQTAAALRDEGHAVIDLTVGEPDFDTPAFIKEFAVEGLQKGYTKYTSSAGMKMFQEAVAGFFAQNFNSTFTPAAVAASCGGKQALFNAACCILDPGDELLLPKPYWVTFPEIGHFCGAQNVYIDTEATDFVLTAEQVEAAITDKTKLLIVNSPNNPTGRVIPQRELRKIIELCAEKGVYVLTDECYLFFAYPPNEVFSSASLPAELLEHVCIAGSFSKTFAMTGWRIGFTIANPEWTKAMVKLQSHSATHPASFVQYACAKALGEPAQMMEAVGNMMAEYTRRKEWLIPRLNEVKGFRCGVPEGAFYAFVDVREMLGGEFQTSADVAERLLKEAYVVVTDGEGFGAEGYLRVSYANSIENLETAVKAMKQVFGSQVSAAA